MWFFKSDSHSDSSRYSGFFSWHWGLSCLLDEHKFHKGYINERSGVMNPTTRKCSWQGYINGKSGLNNGYMAGFSIGFLRTVTKCCSSWFILVYVDELICTHVHRWLVCTHVHRWSICKFCKDFHFAKEVIAPLIIMGWHYISTGYQKIKIFHLANFPQ